MFSYLFSSSVTSPTVVTVSSDGELASVREQLRVMELENKLQSRQLEEVSQSLTEIEREKRKLTREAVTVAELKETIQRLEGQIDELNTTISNLERDKRALTRNVTKLEENSNTTLLQEENRRLLRQLSEVDSDYVTFYYTNSGRKLHRNRLLPNGTFAENDLRLSKKAIEFLEQAGVFSKAD